MKTNELKENKPKLHRGHDYLYCRTCKPSHRHKYQKHGLFIRCGCGKLKSK